MTPKKAGLLYLLVILLHLYLGVVLPMDAAVIPALSKLSIQTFAGEGLILLPCLIFSLAENERAQDLYPFRKIRALELFLTLLLFAVSYPIAGILNAISTRFTENAVEGISDEILAEPFPLMLFVIGIFGPFCEELCFRGILLQTFRRTGRDIGAAVLSAALFGLLHLNLNQCIYAFFLGLVFALADEAAESIWPSFLLHCAVNCISVTAMFSEDIQGEEISYGVSPLSAAAVLFALAALVVLLILILAAMRKAAKRSPEMRQTFPSAGRRLIFPALVIGMGIAAGYIISEELITYLF